MRLIPRPAITALSGLLLTLVAIGAWLYRAESILREPPPPLELHSLQLQHTAQGRQLLLGGSGLSSASQVTLTPDLSNGRKQVAEVPTGSQVADIVLSGHYALLANSLNGLRVVDLTDPTAPRVVAGLTLNGYAMGVAVQGGYGFVAANDAGLAVVDLTDPLRPSLVGHCPLPGNATRLAIAGHYAYVAAMKGGLQIVDIANPRAPAVVGSLPSADHTFALDLKGSLAYLADGAGGLAIVNIANPQAPVLTGHLSSPGLVMDTVVQNGYAYITGLSTGVQAIDVRRPANPMPVAKVDIGLRGYGLEARGNSLVVASMDGLLQLDVSRPDQLRLLGEVLTKDAVKVVRLRKGLAFVGGMSNFHIIDTTEPEALPQHLRQFPASNPRLAHQLLQGQLLVAIDQRMYLQPLTPTGFGRPTPLPLLADHAIWRIAHTGRWSAAVDASNLYLLDMERHAAALRYRPQGDNHIYSLALRPPYVYLGLEHSLQILRYRTTGGGLELMGRLPLPAPAQDLLLDGNVLYLANGKAGLRIIDVGAARSPRLIGTYASSWPEQEFAQARNLAKRGDRLFIACLRAGVEILDVSTPERPQRLQTLQVPQMAMKVQVDGPLAYVIQGKEEVALLDIGGPTARLVGTIPGSRRTCDLIAHDSQLILSNINGTVTVLPTPLRLTQIPSADAPGTLRLQLPKALPPGPYQLRINNYRQGGFDSVHRFFTL